MRRFGFKQIIKHAMFIVMIAVLLSGCSKEADISSLLPGSWFSEGSQEAAFVLYDDGTCEIAGEYGTGTWSVVNDNQLKLTNYYGETEVAAISEITEDKLVLDNGKVTQTFLNTSSSSDVKQNEELLEEHDSQEPLEGIPVSVQLTDGTMFSDGVAWVEYADQTSAEKIGIVNTEGKITPIIADEITRFGSDFSDGYAYVNYEDKSNPSVTLKQFVIIDKAGNIVSRSPSDGNYEILTGGDSLFLVQQAVQSMTANEIRIGIIDKDGNWIFDPAVQNPLSLSSAAKDIYQRGTVNYLYHGDHIFSAYYKSDFNYSGSNYLCIYNADTGVTAEYENMKLSYAGYTDANIPYRFSDGKAIAVSDDTVYCVDTDLNITSILEDRPDGDVYYRNGVIFTGEWHYSGNGPSPYVKNGKFYNMDGSVLVDLSQYTLIVEQAYELYRYEDGFAAIQVYGEDHERYLGIIDMDGEFAFEPLKIETYSNQDNIGIFSCGVIATQIKENVDEKTFSKHILLTTTGEITEVDVDYGTIGSLVFIDGFAWYDEGKEYIDTAGNIMNVVLSN